MNNSIVEYVVGIPNILRMYLQHHMTYAIIFIY